MSFFNRRAFYSWIPCLAGLLLGLQAASAFSAPLSIGTNAQGSVSYAVGTAVATVARQAGYQMRVIPGGGPMVTISLLSLGRTDFCATIGLVAYSAYRGEQVFPGRSYQNVRLLCVLFPLYQGFFVRKDSRIFTLSDLKGKRIPSRFINQKNITVQTEGLLAAVGISAEDTVKVATPSGTRSVDDFISGLTDAAYFSLTSSKVLQATAAVKGIRVLPIPDDPQLIERIETRIPGAFVSELAAEDHIPGVESRIRVMTQPFVIVVSADLPEVTAYEIVRALYFSKETLAGLHQAFKSFYPEQMYRPMGVPYHPGALRFFQEQGLLQ